MDMPHAHRLQHDRLLHLDERERRFFSSSSSYLPSSLPTCLAALVEQLGSLVHEDLRSRWLPEAVRRLEAQRLCREFDFNDLGLPPADSPIDLPVEQLKAGALGVVLSQRQRFFEADMRAYGREVLSEVQVGW